VLGSDVTKGRVDVLHENGDSNPRATLCPVSKAKTA
jgi:hypothetical protein